MLALRHRRAAAQLLAHSAPARQPTDPARPAPPADPASLVDTAAPQAVVRHLLAVQAQDLRAARLALRARLPGLDALAFDRALNDDRTLVRAWLARGTLHLVAAEDHAWLLAATATPPRFTASRRRLGQEGVPPDDAERAVTEIERALAEHGPLTRAELAEHVARIGIRTAGQAMPHLLALTALGGTIVLGPLCDDGDQAYVRTADWLPATARGPASAAPEPAAPSRSSATARRPTVDRDAAVAELARRYLASHGPATEADLAHWAGLPLRDARAGLQAIARELTQSDHGLVELATAAGDPTPSRIPTRLLPAFDPYLLGWKDRGFAVAPEHALDVHPRGGVIRAVVTVDGLAVGTWGARRRGARVEVTHDRFDAGPLSASDETALQREIADVERFLA